MGWQYVAADLGQPAKTGRASFAEVVQEVTLHRQLYALNLRDVAGVAQLWLVTPVASRRRQLRASLCTA